MKNKKITILDLGSYKIKILVISLDKNNYIEVHAKYSIFSSGIKRGNVIDIEKLSSKIKHCIASIEKELNINIKDIYVGINSINFNFLTFGLSRDIGSYEIEEKKDLQNLINLASGIFFHNLSENKIIHFLNSGFYLDKKNYVENPKTWVNNLYNFLEKQIEQKMELDTSSYSLQFRIIGVNGTLGDLETKVNVPTEVGILCIITSPKASISNEIAKLINPFLLHYPLTNNEELPTFAFPYSPVHSERGAVYEFALNHTLELNHPMEVFKIETLEV